MNNQKITNPHTNIRAIIESLYYAGLDNFSDCLQHINHTDLLEFDMVLALVRDLKAKERASFGETRCDVLLQQLIVSGLPMDVHIQIDEAFNRPARITAVMLCHSPSIDGAWANSRRLP